MVIEAPAASSPVVNFLANDRYGLLLSSTLGGYSFTAEGELVTRASDRQSQLDQPGRTIYLRDHDTGQVWNLSGLPAPVGTTDNRCRHALGYSAFEATAGEIDLAAQVFVPATDPVELWDIKLTNLTKTKHRLSLYFVLEWASNFDHHALAGNALIATSREKNISAFAAFDHSLDSFETNPEKFFGRFRGYSAPQALEDGRLGRSQGDISQGAIAVLEKKVSLGQEANFELGVIVGTVESKRAKVLANQLINRYNDTAKRSAALAVVQKNYQLLTDREAISSPDQAFNGRYQFWSVYQHHLASRFPALLSYSDQSLFRPLKTTALLEQLTLVVTDNVQLALERLKIAASAQTKDGSLGEFWLAESDLTASAEATVSFIRAAVTVILETGDEALLKTHLPYRDGGSGSLLEHLNKAVSFLISQLSHRQLLTKEAESIPLTGQFSTALQNLLPLLEAAGDHHQLKRLQELIETVAAAINRQWTGRSFPQSLTPDKVGFPGQKYHQLDLQSQIWPILSHIADESRTKRSLTTVKQQLNQRGLIADFAPAYAERLPGRSVSVDLPGVGANGAATIAHQCLLAQAYAEQGDGGELWRLLQLPGFFIPSSISLNSTSYGQLTTEFGGLAAGAWRRAVRESLAGVTPTLKGLKINPCLPRDWRTFEINRRWRGAEYRIQINNPLRVCRGVNRVIVDGSRIVGHVVPPFRAGVHRVEVFLG